MQLRLNLKSRGCADGHYILRAKGALAASLQWANAEGALPDWTQIAFLPVSPSGTADFRFEGGRAIPPEATHVLARAVTADFSEVYECIAEIPSQFRTDGMNQKTEADIRTDGMNQKPEADIRTDGMNQNTEAGVRTDGMNQETEAGVRIDGMNQKPEADILPQAARIICDKEPLKFAVMSDLHISGKTGRLMRALNMVRNMQPDALLIPGDLVNDGLPDQYERLMRCLEELPESLPVVAAAGNHDYPQKPLPLVKSGVSEYADLQMRLIERCRTTGCAIQTDVSGAWAVTFGGVDVIALNAVTHWRRFAFPGREQLTWLNEYLGKSGSSKHVILCHAPLIAHNQQRRGSSAQPYLSADGKLQEIVDRYSDVIFISGHTHLSPHLPGGCVEVDSKNRNIYIDDGSLCPNELKKAETLMSSEWADGTIPELEIGKESICIKYHQIHSAKKIARGYYRIPCA